jgi:hypothetical protein
MLAYAGPSPGQNDLRESLKSDNDQVETDTLSGSSSDSEHMSDDGGYCRYFDPPIQLYTSLNNCKNQTENAFRIRRMEGDNTGSQLDGNNGVQVMYTQNSNSLLSQNSNLEYKTMENNYKRAHRDSTLNDDNELESSNSNF